MLVFRGAVTQHPRGSISAPALSPHYWIPPTSVSCTGVTEIQSLLAPFSAAALLSQGCNSAAPPLIQGDENINAKKQGGEDATAIAVSSEPLHTSFPPESRVKRSWSPGIAFFVSALLAFGGSLVVMLVVSHLLQPRELAAEEQMVTAVARQPLVPEQPSGQAFGKNAAASHDVTTEPVPANHSLVTEREDQSLVGTTPFMKGRSVLRGRTRRRSGRPRSTAAVPAAKVDNSLGTETTPWLD